MSNSNEGNGKEGGGQATVRRATVTATIWAMVMAAKLASNKEAKATGEGSKGNYNGNEVCKKGRG